MTRNSYKLILVLLACAIPLVAVLVNARQDNRPPVGLHARAEAARAASKAPQFDGQREAEAYLRSDEPAGHNVVGLGAVDNPTSPLRPSPAGERGWMVVLAAMGLALSLAAAGCLAWLRSRPAQFPVTMRMPQKMPQASMPAATIAPAVNEKPPSRRAA